jgi:hypothetical protein
MCNESVEVLRATIAAMLYTKAIFLSGGDKSIVRGEETFEILQFSKRCLMPWVGIGYALLVVKSSNDAALLLGLITRADFFQDMDLQEDEAAWRQVLALASQGVAKVIVEARRLPLFGEISLQMLETILESVADDEWSEEVEVSFPCRVNDSPSKQDPVKNSHGVSLEFPDKHYARQSIHAYIDTKELPDMISVAWQTCAFMNVAVTQIAREGENEAIDLQLGAYRHYVPLDFDDSERFDNGDPPTRRFIFKSRFTKLHRQCLALMSFHAQKRGAKCRSECLKDTWRYFRELKRPNLSEIPKRGMCLGFSFFFRMSASAFEDCRCDELESILSDRDHLRAKNEMQIFGAVVDCAMRQDRRPEEFRIGDFVRTKYKSWQISGYEEADCIVTEIDHNHVTVKLAPANFSNGDSPEANAETHKVSKCDLFNATETIFVKLLPHVRMGCLKLAEFGEISFDALCCLYRLPAFKVLFKKMIDVQTGRKAPKILGQDGKPRDKSQRVVVGATNEPIKEFLSNLFGAAEWQIDDLLGQNEQLSKKIKELEEEVKESYDDMFELECKYKTECEDIQQKVAARIESMSLAQLEALVERKRSEAAAHGNTGSSSISAVEHAQPTTVETINQTCDKAGDKAKPESCQRIDQATMKVLETHKACSEVAAVCTTEGCSSKRKVIEKGGETTSDLADAPALKECDSCDECAKRPRILRK